jgi:hypothetical protein
MRLVVCIIGGAVLCGSFSITLRLIEPEAPPQRLEDQRISHYNDLPTATRNAGLARIDEILAQRPQALALPCPRGTWQGGHYVCAEAFGDRTFGERVR